MHDSDRPVQQHKNRVRRRTRHEVEARVQFLHVLTVLSDDFEKLPRSEQTRDVVHGVGVAALQRVKQSVDDADGVFGLHHCTLHVVVDMTAGRGGSAKPEDGGGQGCQLADIGVNKDSKRIDAGLPVEDRLHWDALLLARARTKQLLKC